MSTIHQIYCTHCTYGSSALERREGELAHRMLGYSVRAGSAEAHDLRHYYRQVEQYLYYYLPRDTPAEDKLRLMAATAPWRLIYLPAGSGHQFLGQICYRQTDTEGRPGSYFAHVLLGDPRDAQADWSPLECLKLWGAAGWVREDAANIPFRLRPLAALEEMLAGAPPAIDDEIFLSFLSAPADGNFHDPAGVIPDRWRRQEAALRRRTFAEALAALLELGGQRGGSLLLLIEPSMAALFFYGMLRLLPGGIREALSFSTFEPNPDRLCTTLAATWFCNPDKADLRPAALRTSAVVLSTIEGHRLAAQHSEAAYASCMVDRLLEEGWPAVDRSLENFQAVEAGSFEDLHRLALVDRLLAATLAGQQPSTQWPGQPMAAAYLRRTLLQRLSGADEPAAVLRPVVGTPAHLPMLALLAADVQAPVSRKAFEYLLLNLPDRKIADALLLLYRRYGREFFQRYPQDEPALGEKLRELLRTLPDHLDEFPQRLDLILAAEPLLPSDLELCAAAGWVRCRRAIVEIGRLQHRRNAVGFRQLGPLEDAAREMAEAAAQALPRELFDDDRQGTKKQQCLRCLGETLLKGDSLLLENVWQHAALWRKIGWYFESGKWPDVRLRFMRRRIRGRRPSGMKRQPRAARPQARNIQPRSRNIRWIVIGGAVVGLIALSIGISAWIVWARRGSPPAVPPQPRAVAENLAAANPLAAGAPVPEEAEKPAPETAVSAAAAVTEAAATEKPMEQEAARQTAVEREKKTADQGAQTVDKPEAQTTPTPADTKAPAETVAPTLPEAAPQKTASQPATPHETAPQKDVGAPGAGNSQPPKTVPAAEPPAASDAAAANVAPIAGQFKTDISLLRRRLDKPYVAELNILVPPASVSKRSGAEFQVNCTVREQTADGGQRTKTLDEVFKKKTHPLLDDIVKVEVRFEFYRKRDLLPGQTPHKAAETRWYPIDPIEKGKEYSIQFQPAKEALEKP